MPRTQVARYVAKAWVEKTRPRSALVELMAAYLVDGSKVHEADLLVNDVKHEIQKNYGVVVGSIKSATPLTHHLQVEIQEFVKDITKARRVMLDEKVDPSLLGGAIISTPEMEIDISVRTKLEALKGIN